ncbi:NAD(P)-dependent oxidoreductase [Bradyrhizobium sp. BR 10261]|uniref:NAD(P)-dependent oxidoreductase n=1 Tax=Bradyrhizobium sp. BR 10261 TaxID=2749992 RepID=UPI001C64FB14|nr:NAD(P)-dependent oxidoreductase [Bradyrhizobium sp. BR 10261]MBW7967169.1 NAD(P)-dependent oxidoreductase [Bradyrhizobium sp. BR 10261]
MVGSVGFVGLGAIGSPIAHRILLRRGALTVFDINAAACEPLIVQGARRASSVAEIADLCDVVFVCVDPPDAYRQVVLGADGIIDGSRLRYYVHIGTTGPDLIRELAEALGRRGIVTLDAPMTGGPARAREGRMTVMAAGDAAALKAIEPLFAAYATHIVPVAPEPGPAQILKIINNTITAANLAVAAEALVLGTKAGLDPAAILEVVNSGSARSDVTMTKFPRHVLTRSFDFGAAMSLVSNDLGACLREAERLRVPMSVGRAVWELFRRAMTEGSSRDDLTRVVERIEAWAGVEHP